MRVCVVTIAGHGLGGMQDHTRDLARGLAAAGHDVDVVTTRGWGAAAAEAHEGARWHFVGAPGRYDRLPFHHHEWLRRSYERFAELHANRPYDVVHSESTSALELVRRGVHRQVPVVVKYHGNFIGLTRASWLRARDGDARSRVREAKAFVWRCGMHVQRWECFRFRDCEWMVPAAQQFEDTLRGEFLRRGYGHVVPNGVDTSVFRPRDVSATRNELGLDGAGPYLVGVGRLNYEKGFDLAIRAIATGAGARSAARLVIVGEGEERQALVSLARALGVEDRVLFAGAVGRETVARYMSAADIFLFPTLREEAAPLVLPQAMACGVPVVASRIGGIAEAAGAAAVLVTPGDERLLAAAVDRLLGDSAERARLGAAARQRVLEEYTLEQMIERSLDVYRIAIARSGPVTPSLESSDLLHDPVSARRRGAPTMRRVGRGRRIR